MRRARHEDSSGLLTRGLKRVRTAGANILFPSDIWKNITRFLPLAYHAVLYAASRSFAALDVIRYGTWTHVSAMRTFIEDGHYHLARYALEHWHWPFAEEHLRRIIMRVGGAFIDRELLTHVRNRAHLIFQGLRFDIAEHWGCAGDARALLACGNIDALDWVLQHDATDRALLDIGGVLVRHAIDFGWPSVVVWLTEVMNRRLLNEDVVSAAAISLDVYYYFKYIDLHTSCTGYAAWCRAGRLDVLLEHNKRFPLYKPDYVNAYYVAAIEGGHIHVAEYIYKRFCVRPEPRNWVSPSVECLDWLSGMGKCLLARPKITAGHMQNIEVWRWWADRHVWSMLSQVYEFTAELGLAILRSNSPSDMVAVTEHLFFTLWDSRDPAMLTACFFAYPTLTLEMLERRQYNMRKFADLVTTRHTQKEWASTEVQNSAQVEAFLAQYKDDPDIASVVQCIRKQRLIARYMPSKGDWRRPIGGLGRWFLKRADALEGHESAAAAKP